MQLRRNEILTGILTLGTLAIFFFFLIVVGAPGIIHPLKTYYVLLPNVAGMKSGAPVFLAGRNIGQVVEIDSPIPMKDRPKNYKHYEVKVTISVDKEAAIYNSVSPHLRPLGLLGEQILDFRQGDETSGLAADGKMFIGEKSMDIVDIAPEMLKMVQPVTQELTQVLKEGQQMLKESKRTVRDLNGLLSEEGPLRETAENAKDFTDTIKRQPWRLVWKSDKKYPEDKYLGQGPQQKK